MKSQKDTLDLIWGVEAIGRLIGRSYQQTYHMIQCGHLPMVRKMGERYVASRAKLVAFFLEDAAWDSKAKGPERRQPHPGLSSTKSFARTGK